MSYSNTEFLASQYADTTVTKCVALSENTCYAVKMLSLNGVLMSPTPPDGSISIETEFVDSGDNPSATGCYRINNCFIATEDGSAIVVLPLAYEPLLETRMVALVSSLADGDATLAYQYISMLSSHTKNKLAEHNQHREYKARRQRTITPWQL